MNQLPSSRLLPPQSRSAIPRRVLLVVLGLLLFALGQFEESVFMGLTRLWQLVPLRTGQAAWNSAAPHGLSTHGLPVGIMYRLLYCGVSVGVLHVLLRGHRTGWVAGGYALALAVSMALLLLGQQASLPLASRQGHQLLDLVCSPLPLLVGYVLLLLQGSAQNTYGNRK